jgi:protease-4
MKRLWRFIVGSLAAIGAAVVLVGVAAFAIAIFWPGGAEPLPDKMVLRVNFEGELQDRRKSVGFLFEKQDLVLREVVMGLRAAATDERVSGIAVYMGGFGVNLSTAQELRTAIMELRRAGKTARLFTEDLGGLGGGSAAYYLASAFDEIWVQPSGGVGLIGIAMEIPYAKGLMDKLEVEPRFGQRHEYKSAVESWTRYAMSDPARQNLQVLLDSLYGQLVSGIAESRGFDEAEVRQLVDSGPYLAQEALEKRLIDRIGYWDEFIDENMEVAGEEVENVFLDDYLAGIDRPNSEGPKVALIYGNGAISMGAGDDGDGFEGSGFKAHSVADAGQRGRQAGHRVDGHDRRLRRLFRRNAGRPGCCPAGHHHGIDRRLRRQTGHRKAVGAFRHRLGRTACRRKRGHVELRPGFPGRWRGTLPRDAGFHL